MKRIILKKESNCIKIVLVDKHKIIDLIGYKKDMNKIFIDLEKLSNYNKKGVWFSKSAFNLIYKSLFNITLNVEKLYYDEIK